MNTSYCEIQKGKKILFWKIDIVDGTTITETSGTLGTKGKSSTQKHQTKAKATAYFKKIEKQKVAEGYIKKGLPKVEPNDKKSKVTKKLSKAQQKKADEEEEKELQKKPVKKVKSNPETKTNVAKKESKSNVSKKKSKEQQAKPRTIVVDRMVPGSSSQSIYKEYAVKLNQANIDGGNNNNKFYIIQLLENNGKYSTWNRWGRIGEPGQNMLKPFQSNLDGAIKDFEKKFRDKTSNSWSIRQSTPGKQWVNFCKVKGKYTVVETEDVEGGEDNDAPMGKLTESQVEKGQEVLSNLMTVLKGTAKKNKSEDINLLSSEFYSLIPTQSGRQRLPSINTIKMAEEKEELLKFMMRMGFQDISSQQKKGSPISGVMDLKVPSSLWDACKQGSICDQYSSNSSNDKADGFAKQQVGSPIRKMAQALYGAILLYTSNAIYADLNKSLREENHAKIKKYFPYLRLFFEALDHLPKKQKQVWRGVSVDLSKDYTVGKEITWWGVSSTTTNKGVAHGFASSCGNATLLTIDCKSAADISAVTHYPHEAENLLPPGTVLKVMSSKKNGNMAEIHLKEIDQLGTK